MERGELKNMGPNRSKLCCQSLIIIFTNLLRNSVNRKLKKAAEDYTKNFLTAATNFKRTMEIHQKQDQLQQ